ncbi:MAG TPA: GntR family transcriptional regulator [Dehalococcoidia bacterium]|nr:GntR family transcriptional regulator [Dehalococcoidia bacterium]
MQLRAPTRTEDLLERVRLDLVHNAFPPGSRVTEEAIAERYGVSRTPVREVLRVLAREALLSYLPRKGYVVPTMDPDEMEDLYVVRVGIEEQVAARLHRSADVQMLVGLQEVWSSPPEGTGGNLNVVFADEHFHESLAIASGSTALPPLLRNINQRLHPLRIHDFEDAERVQRTFEQHAAIVSSVLAGDTRLAQAQLRAHILQSYAFVRSRVFRSPAEVEGSH